MLRATHSSAVPLVVGLILIIASLTLAFRRSRPLQHKRRNAWGSLGWALLFMSSGRIPPPPPESQIEQDLNARDNRRQNSGSDHNQ